MRSVPGLKTLHDEKAKYLPMVDLAFLIFLLCILMNKDLLYHLFLAWKNLRRNKTTNSILAFELEHEKELIQLARELESQTYRISPYRCFIIYDPVQREIFAAHVRDRIVHHLLYHIISPFFERIFIHDNYACRVGK